MRPDIHKQGLPETSALFEMSRESSGCTCTFSDYAKTLEQGFKAVSGIYFIVDEYWPYDSKRKGTWNGVSCDVYYLSASEYSFWIYADKNDRIIGYRDSSDDSSSSMSFSYSTMSFNDEFIIPSRSSGCSNPDYAKAFEPPELNKSCSVIYNGTAPCSVFVGSGDSIGVIIAVSILSCVILIVAVIIFIVWTKKRRYRRLGYNPVNDEQKPLQQHKTAITPGTTHGTTPGTTPGITPGSTRGTTPGSTPGATPGTTPGGYPQNKINDAPPPTMGWNPEPSAPLLDPWCLTVI